MQIERILSALPLVELPPWERQQLAIGVRDRVFASYRTIPMPNAAAALPREISTIVHAQPTEVIMPMRKVVSGFFECPLCQEEYELDRVPEPEAKCDACHVKLEEVEEEDDDGD